MDKKALLKEVIQKIQEEKKEVEKSFKFEKRLAVEAPSAMDSHSDTSRFQMEMLAQNLALNAEERARAVNLLNQLLESEEEKSEVAMVGSLVEIEKPPKKKRLFYFLLPAGGGISLDDENVVVITPQAPIAEMIIGKKAGDVIKTSPSSEEIKIVNII